MYHDNAMLLCRKFHDVEIWGSLVVENVGRPLFEQVSKSLCHSLDSHGRSPINEAKSFELADSQGKALGHLRRVDLARKTPTRFLALR